MLNEIEEIEIAISKIRKQHEEASAAVQTDEIVAEIPELVKEVVTYLQPLLTPYEAAYYWHLFTKPSLRTSDKRVFSR